MFRKVDMKALRLFGVVIVCRAKEPDRRSVMRQAVELWQVEMLPYSKVKENVLVLMKDGKTVLQLLNGVACLALVLSDEEKVHERTHSSDYA
jgi:hypothetical protein